MISLAEYEDTLRPDVLVGRMDFLNFEKLAREEKRYNVIFDLDGCLLPGDTDILTPAVESHIQKARAAGWIRHMGILSNTWLPIPKVTQRVEQCADHFSAPFCCCMFYNLKPGAGGYKKVMHKMGPEVNPENTMIVGDQLFTDIAGGKRLGLHTALVLSLGGDSPATRRKRLRERPLLEKYDLERLLLAQEQRGTL